MSSCLNHDNWKENETIEHLLVKCQKMENKIYCALFQMMTDWKDEERWISDKRKAQPGTWFSGKTAGCSLVFAFVSFVNFSCNFSFCMKSKKVLFNNQKKALMGFFFSRKDVFTLQSVSKVSFWNSFCSQSCSIQKIRDANFHFNIDYQRFELFCDILVCFTLAVFNALS